MQEAVNKLIKIAEAEIGYLEKASNASLDSKTANAGTANFTKYARDLDAIPEFYNGNKNGYAWCDVFVDWCFVKAFGVEEAQKLLCQPDESAGAGCTYSARYYKNKGQFHKSPKAGDQIFFGTEGNVTHTGIVYKVDSEKVYTIEGNTSGASGEVSNGGGVCKKSYSLSYNRIYGYGRPAYNGETAAEDNPVEKAPEKPGKVISVTVKQLSKGSKGAPVKALQILLKGHKLSLGVWGVDSDFGSATEAAVRKFQAENGLEVDGVVGPMTWAKLLGMG